MDEITQAQASLGLAIHRARAGEDRALAGRVRDEGARLVNLLFGVLGMARLHSLDNRAFDQPIHDLNAVLGELIDLLGVLHLLVVEDQIYLNDIRIRLEGRVDVATEFGARLRQHDVGGITLHGILTKEQLRKMTTRLNAPPSGEHPRSVLQAALAAEGLSNVEVVGVHRFRTSDEKVGGEVRSLTTIEERGATLLEETWRNLTAGRLPNPLPLRRLVTDILDVPSEDSEYWMIPEGAGEYAAHTLRVGKLALMIGRQLGLPSGALQDLGVAAMYHDVGYTEFSPTGDAETSLESHGRAGARILVRQRGFHEAKIRRVLAALDHHRRYDEEARRPSLFGRILAIAEDYDILVQERGGGLTPPEALARMAAVAGTIYDSVLMQLFINALGRYPYGTLLRLDDGRIGRVVSRVRSSEEFEKPAVHIVRLANGTRPLGTVDIALSSPTSPRIAGVVGEREIKPEADVPTPVLREEKPTTPPTKMETGDAFQADKRSIGGAFETRAATPGVESDMPQDAGVSIGAPKIAKDAASMDSRAGQPLTLGLLPKIFGEIYRKRRTGTLSLTLRDERRNCRFWKGNLVRASSNMKSEQLGEVAIRQKFISSAQLDRASEIVLRDKKRLGLVLLELKLVTEAQLGELFSAHVRGVLAKPFQWSDGYYDFEEQQPDASWSEEVAFSLSTPDLILEAVRGVGDPDVIRYLLGDLSRALRLSRDPMTQSAVSSLGALDGFLLSRVDNHLSAREIFEMIPERREAVEQCLYGLLCIGLLEWGESAGHVHNVEGDRAKKPLT